MRPFEPPTLVAHPGGLRFELSGSGSNVSQFLTTLRKAQAVCATVFMNRGTRTLCLRTYGSYGDSSNKEMLRALIAAGIQIPRQRNIWAELVDEEEWAEPDCPEHWVNVAFQIDQDILPNALWCAFASDLGIRPTRTA